MSDRSEQEPIPEMASVVEDAIASLRTGDLCVDHHIEVLEDLLRDLSEKIDTITFVFETSVDIKRIVTTEAGEES